MIDTDRLQSAISATLSTITSEHTRRAYARNLAAFLAWFERTGQPAICKGTTEAFLDDLATKGASPATLNQSLAAIRKLADFEDRFAIFKTIKSRRIDAKKTRGLTLTRRQIEKLLNAPNIATLKGLRDRALLAVFAGCGLKRDEVANLTFEQIGRIHGQPTISLSDRTVPIPAWTKQALDAYARKARSKRGRVFLKTSKGGELLSEPLSEQFITKMVIAYGVEHLGIETTPADLRRSFATLAYERGTPIDQIQVLLGHDSVQNTRLLLGIENKQKVHASPGDRFGIKI